jgi:hypothetical protein
LDDESDRPVVEYDPIRYCASARCQDGHVAVARGDETEARRKVLAKLDREHPDCMSCGERLCVVAKSVLPKNIRDNFN